MRPRRRMGRTICSGLAALALAACDFIDPVTADPNVIPDATLDQLLAAITVKSFDRAERRMFYGSLWMQQMDGIGPNTGRPSRYLIDEGAGGELFTGTYNGAGLVDIRLGIADATQAGHRSYAGILKVYEAYFVGTTASAYGDIPYSEAVNPGIPTPALDPQRDVYEALQGLLDEAIADLQSGEGIPPTAADLAFGGDVGAWVTAAHTLKARLHLHWAEVDGRTRYMAALEAANQGIPDASRDWVTNRSNEPDEHNLWHYDSPDGWVAGQFLVEALKARADPRLPFYFGEGSGPYGGQFVGSHPNDHADPGTDASELACGANFTGPGACPLERGYATRDWGFPILSCAENHFIMAEAEFHVGTEAGARAALDAALACEEIRKGVDLSAARSAVGSLSGAALFDEIMLQKYLSVFLAGEVWNDYKRTCRPAITTYGGLQVPGRLFYPGQGERGSNPNIPSPEEQLAADPHGRPGGANANDPNPCP